MGHFPPTTNPHTLNGSLFTMTSTELTYTGSPSCSRMLLSPAMWPLVTSSTASLRLRRNDVETKKIGSAWFVKMFWVLRGGNWKKGRKEKRWKVLKQESKIGTNEGVCRQRGKGKARTRNQWNKAQCLLMLQCCQKWPRYLNGNTRLKIFRRQTTLLEEEVYMKVGRFHIRWR